MKQGEYIYESYILNLAEMQLNDIRNGSHLRIICLQRILIKRKMKFTNNRAFHKCAILKLSHTSIQDIYNQN